MYRFNRFRGVVVLVMMCILISGCKVIQQQVTEMQAFTKCQFRIASVNRVLLAGVDVQNVRGLSSLNLMQVASLTNAYLSKNLPLSFTLNVESKNPTTNQAALGGFDWQLLIDGQQFVSGNNPSRVAIGPNGGTVVIPMQMNLELFKALSGKSKDAVLNFGMALAGQNGQSSRVSLRIKPSFVINGYTYAFPNFIEVGKDFKALK